MSNELTPAQIAHRYATDIEKSASEYLANIVGGEGGRRAAARLGMAMRSIARANPKVYECDRASVVACVAMSALTGLEPGGPFPAVYVLPRALRFQDEDGQWKSKQELQWQISFRGMLTLAQRAGYQLRSIAVYKGDDFDLDLGAMRPQHRPVERTEEPAWEQLRGVYVVAYQTETGALAGWEWLPRWQIEKRRNNSDAYRRGAKQGASERDRSSPWFQWPEEMARKTAIRYAVSRGLVPLDDVAAHALEADDKSDRVVETTAEVVAAPKVATKQLGTGALDEAIAGMKPAEREVVEVVAAPAEGGAK